MGDHATTSENDERKVKVIEKKVNAIHAELDNLYDALQKSEWKSRVVQLELQMNRVMAIEDRLIRIERAYDALGRRLEGSERHPEDEGWFD